MSLHTKQDIIDATIHLAETKAINKITIRDIVDACGITRNSFYYYFHDIYDVLDSTISDELAKLGSIPAEEMDDVLFNVVEFAAQYKKVWRNLYNSLGQEKLSDYIMRRIHHIFVDYILMFSGEREISDRDLSIICAFFEEAMFGVLVRWVKSDISNAGAEEMKKIALRIRVLFDGIIEHMITNSLDNPEKENAI